jgi:hypothetical protein
MRGIRPSHARVRVSSRSNRLGPGIVRHSPDLNRWSEDQETQRQIELDRALGGGIFVRPRSYALWFSNRRGHRTRSFFGIQRHAQLSVIRNSAKPRPQWERHIRL